MNLKNCDQEQIHLSGAIQPHGLLIAVESLTLIITHVSDNCPVFLNHSPQDLIGFRIESIFKNESLIKILQIFDVLRESSAYSHFCSEIKLKNNNQLFSTILHQINGLVVLEFEPQSLSESKNILRFYRDARISGQNLKQTSILKEFLDLSAQENKQLTKFDRVMIYRFHPDYHGEVVSEARREDLEPYLGLHYPESDIPSQARDLYVKNRIRIIPNIDYTPSLICPSKTKRTDLPLDLSFSILRSVSPIHLQYLRNMGVTASMSISLVQDEKLWGLIAFHHQSPKLLPLEIRTALENIANTMILKIKTLEDKEQFNKTVKNKSIESKIFQEMTLASSPLKGLIKEQTALLDLVRAKGLAILINGELNLFGNTPPHEEVEQLIPWILNHLETSLFFTDCLSSLYDRARKFSNTASGVLVIVISKKTQDLLIWFRPEAIESIDWAGDPNKSVYQDSMGILNPRDSFRTFKQSVYLKSISWEEADLSSAADLRIAILDLIIGKSEEISKLNASLVNAIQDREEFLSIASHELKTPLATLHIQLQLLSNLLKKEAPPEVIQKAKSKLEMIENQIDRLNLLINHLIDARQSETKITESNSTHSKDLSHFLEAICSKFENDFLRAGSVLRKDISPQVTGCFDPFRLEQSITNLLTNAIKYGNHKPVEVILKRAGNSKIQIIVRDHGIGIPPDKKDLIFNRFTRAMNNHKYRGLGLGLWIVKQSITAQGGEVWVESTPGEGSTFTIELQSNC